MANASIEMAVYCFDVIYSVVNRAKDPELPLSIPNIKVPLFVTWKIGAEHNLRGCIGTFSDLRLDRGLNEYAKISAFQDTRFNPIVKDEIPRLQCGVSLLINFEDIDDYLDWQIGVHGVRMNFVDRGKHRSSVFLPEVAAQEDWDHVTTIDNLLRKAGYKDHIDENLRRSVKLVRFQSSKVVLDYKDYLSFKKSRGQRLPH